MELIGILLFLATSAFFSGIETGVISANHLRLRHMVERRVRGASTILRFYEDSERLLGTVLVGTNLSNVAASVLAVRLATRLSPEHGEWVSAIATTVVILVLGEMAPKAWFQQAPGVRSVRFAIPLDAAYRGLWPFVRMTQGIARFANLLVGSTPEAAAVLVTRDELVHLARESAAGGRLSSEEESMIDAALEARRTRVSEVMVSAPKSVTVDPNDPVDQVLARARERGVSRIPVVEPQSRKPLGLVSVYDLLFEPERHPGSLAREVMREARTVGASDTVDHALARLKEWRQPLAPVTDRRGKFAGVVSIEDVLEQVVGEIEG